MTSLRTLLNVAYTYLARGKDEKGIRDLDKLLEQEPRSRPVPKGRAQPTGQSRGMQDLMMVMGLPMPPPRKPKPQAGASA